MHSLAVAAGEAHQGSQEGIIQGVGISPPVVLQASIKEQLGIILQGWHARQFHTESHQGGSSDDDQVSLHGQSAALEIVNALRDQVGTGQLVDRDGKRFHWEDTNCFTFDRKSSGSRAAK